MTALLVGKQQLAVLGRRKSTWEIIIKTGDHWDFSPNSLRLRVVEAAQAGDEAIVVMDAEKDDRFFCGADKSFRSALCIPVHLPGGLSITIFAEEPNRAMAFSLGVVPTWLELAKGLEGLVRTPAPAPEAEAAPAPSVVSSKPKKDDEAEEDSPPAPSISWPRLIGAGLCLVIGVGYAINTFVMSRLQDQLHHCNSNIQNLVTAANMYARNHKNVYPKDLDTLLKDHYVERIPTCPAAGHNTYTDINFKVEPPGLSIACRGGYHRRFFHGSGDPDNWPVFPVLK